MDKLSAPQTLQKNFKHISHCLKMAHIGAWQFTLIKEPFSLHDLKWDGMVHSMHGAPLDESIDPLKWLQQIILPDDLLFICKSAMSSFKKKDYAEIVPHSYRINWPNGEIHHIEIYASFEDPGPNENKVSVYGIAKDITQDILKQKLIEEQQNHLLSVSRLAVLDEAFSGIAHEINNPLTVIQARSFQLIQMAEQGGLDALKIKAVAESINKAGDKIVKIVKSMDAFTQEDPTQNQT